MTTSQTAAQLNDRGRAHDERGEIAEAIEAYRAAAAADPAWSVPWYNLGLLYKYRGAWEESAAHNREAVRRDEGSDAAWWNLGIAATALERWAVAREAWARCGIALPEGSGPIEARFGLTPIRLDPRGRSEVVWCERIDPARAIVRNVPFPESGHRWGDLVLHDGARAGVRLLDGREVPVFDALQRLRASDHRTWILDLPDTTAEARGALDAVARDLGGAAEDWSRSVRFLCRSCSEGRPHEAHDTELEADRPALAVGAAATDERHLATIVAAWREATGHEGYVGWVLALEDTTGEEQRP